MSIQVSCPQCGKSLRAPDTMAGKRARCPNCQTAVSIPQPPRAEDDDSYSLAAEEPPPKPTPKPRQTPPQRTPAARPMDAPFDRQSTAKAMSPAARAAETSAGWTAGSSTMTRKAHPGLSEKPSGNLLHWLFMLTLVPLVFSLLGGASDVEERLGRTIEENPEVLEHLDDGSSEEDLFGALPDGRIDGAHLARDSWVHWLYALVAAGLFVLLILCLFQQGDAQLPHWLGIGLLTATVGVFLLLSFQWIAMYTGGVWLRGGGIVAVLFYIVKLIGFSYSAAMDPENGFLLSMLGFTLGVGLCEELTKALPVIVRYRSGHDLDWRGACVWGLASGVGFGMAEGIMYSSDYYNGISTGGIYLVRFLSCVGLHAIWSAAVGIMLAHNQEWVSSDLDWGDWGVAMVKLLGIPIVLHGLYDTLLKREMNAVALIVALASFAWLAWLIARSESSERETRRRPAAQSS